MPDWPKIENLRREYGTLELSQDTLPLNPFIQFKQWFEEVLAHEKADPTAMVLSTVDKEGCPDSRVVLLKGIDEESFVFFTNYESRKAEQLISNPQCALNFYWPEMARQVRIRGMVEKTKGEQSDAYFASRPITSQVAAIVSKQSAVIPNRKFLEEAFKERLTLSSQKPISRPLNWGGYRVLPKTIEFWQGRDNRLHDRIEYFKHNGYWQIVQLAP